MEYRYAALNKNDVVNGEGICVSFWVQGCPHHCSGCFNPETWNFKGGFPLPENIKEQICMALVANGVQRNLSILGGEPLCPENRELVKDIIKYVRMRFPHIKIFIWTGYLLEDLQKENNDTINFILSKINFLIDGPFIKEQKDLTLKWRGSTNQRIHHMNYIGI